LEYQESLRFHLLKQESLGLEQLIRHLELFIIINFYHHFPHLQFVLVGAGHLVLVITVGHLRVEVVWGAEVAALHFHPRCYYLIQIAILLQDLVPVFGILRTVVDILLKILI
jgi:hypothetical protein